MCLLAAILDSADVQQFHHPRILLDSAGLKLRYDGVVNPRGPRWTSEMTDNICFWRGILSDNLCTSQ